MNHGRQGKELGRLVPEAASLRLRVLSFVRGYFAEWSGSPSYGEIAAALGTNRTRIRKAVKSLSADGLLLRRPGARGLALPEDLAAALNRLRELGWAVDEAARRVTKGTLPGRPDLDYLPPGTGVAADGKQAGSARRRCGGTA